LPLQPPVRTRTAAKHMTMINVVTRAFVFIVLLH